MSVFLFKSYEFNPNTWVATFHYGFDDKSYDFVETIQLAKSDGTYDSELLDRALFTSFCLAGTSYYKTFGGNGIRFEVGDIDSWQSDFLNRVYRDGLSQYAFENQLSVDDLAHFTATTDSARESVKYNGSGIIALQSGGKDSLLVAALLENNDKDYSPWYVTQGLSYPKVLDELEAPLQIARRTIDRAHLAQASQEGARNGHVPITYIMMSYAVLQAVLSGKNTILTAIAHEGEEPHGWIGDLAVNHQWSKTWQAEQLFADYISRYVSPDIHIGSPLRGMSELKLAEIFAAKVWPRFGSHFSSCNIANYKQGSDNTELTWCGNCPKCANSYLLFAPFIDPDELHARLGGELFSRSSLVETFKGLLGIDGVMKPFECVGEQDELRLAYHLSQERGYESLPFDVPESHFDKDAQYERQSWTDSLFD